MGQDQSQKCLAELRFSSDGQESLGGSSARSTRKQANFAPRGGQGNFGVLWIVQMLGVSLRAVMEVLA
jgi:hypothetical protein